jgi:ABC-type multidrug transport system ATPase subunit
VRQRIGVLADQPMVYDELTAVENLTFFARVYGVRPAAPRIREVLELVGLAARAHSAVHTLSRGMKQRLAWARAHLHRPDLLLLDEPFSGLDEAGVGQLRDQLRARRAEGCTCVLVTHQQDLACGLADQQVLLVGGRVVGRAAGEVRSVADLIGSRSTRGGRA